MRLDVAGVDLQQVLQVADALYHLSLFEATMGPRLADVVRSACHQNCGACLGDTCLPVALLGRFLGEDGGSLRLLELRDILGLACRFVVLARGSGQNVEMQPLVSVQGRVALLISPIPAIELSRPWML